jgi:hypothetical protein
MRQQVAQRDRAARRTRERLARVVEAFEHRDLAELRCPSSRGTVEVELALLDELHRRHSRDGLRHRRDPADRVRRHGGAASHHALTECALVDRLIAGGRRGHDPGHVTAGGRALQQGIRLVLQRQRDPPQRP